MWAGAVSKWIGTPYLFGGVDKKGIDCSAFSREVFRDTVRVELPRVSGDQFRTGIAIEKSQLKKGDLVFFDTLERGRITHVAVFDGEGLVAHATSSRGVTKEKLENRWLQRAYEQRDADLVSLKVEPALASLRTEARYRELLRRVGLPE